MLDLSRLPEDPALRSFAELDRAAGQPKGTHFRAFKRLGAALQSGRGAKLPTLEEQVHDTTDFELVTWLVIR